MATRKLKKRNYLGEGYIHVFFHDETGERLIVPCTEFEYKRLGEKDGAKFNPVVEGYSWSHSEGGTIKVDTPDTILGDDEYCVVGDKKIVNLKNADWDKKHQILDAEAVNDKHELDEKKLKQK